MVIINLISDNYLLDNTRNNDTFILIAKTSEGASIPYEAHFIPDDKKSLRPTSSSVLKTMKSQYSGVKNFALASSISEADIAFLPAFFQSIYAFY